MKITAYAVEHLDLLHKIDASPETTFTAIADELGRDQSNLSKTIKRLRDEGIVAAGGVALTDAGRSATRLFTAEGEILADDATLLLRHDQILPDPDNARTDVDNTAIDDLASDIRRRSRSGRVGLLHALTVLPPGQLGARYRLRGGYRRYLAIGALIERGELPGDAPIPCVRHDGVDGVEAMLMAIVENVQREDLHPLDEGSAYARLIHEFHMSADAIADAVRKSRKHVADRVAIAEKLDDDAKRRMRLPDTDDEHLNYAGARRLMQQQNARPKPPVDVTPKEALVLLEIADRLPKRPSHDSGFPGKSGWTRIDAAPAGGAASSLVGKGLIEIAEPSWGSHAFVRIDPNKLSEVTHWIAEKGAMGLWHARAEVVGTGIVGELEQSGRYATPWLNDPLSEPEPATASPPPSPPAGIAPPSPPALPVASPEGELEPSTELAPWEARLAGVPEAAAAKPSSAAIEAPELQLTDTELTILADVAAKIATDPVPGRAGSDGKPAFVGCTVGAYHKDTEAIRFVTEHRLLAFVPSARDVQMCTFTPRGRAWIAAHSHTPHKPPYATAWLNPVAKDEPKPPAPAAAADMPRLTGYGLPIITPPTEIACSNCEKTFELSQDCSDLPSTQQANFFEFEAETADCPHCGAELRLAGVVVTHVDRQGAPL